MAAVKAVLQYRASTGFRESLSAQCPDWLEVVVVPEDNKKRFAAEMTDADVLLHVLEPVTAAVIEAASALKLIQKIGVGVNTIDLDAAKAQGVAVANMPGSNSQAVAEQALMLMLAALRRTVYFDARTREGAGWQSEPDVFDQVGEIGGRTVGLVGFGAIPQCLAPILKAMGARVIYTARVPKPGVDVEWRELHELLAEADIVSLHVPLTDYTEQMIDAAAIERMKPGAVLVNTARGGLVDQTALVDALRTGRVGAAGLDVFAQEPIPDSEPMLGLDNVVLAPHIAWLTRETLARSLGVAIENCRRIRNGEAPLHQVGLSR